MGRRRDKKTDEESFTDPSRQVEWAASWALPPWACQTSSWIPKSTCCELQSCSWPPYDPWSMSSRFWMWKMSKEPSLQIKKEWLGDTLDLGYLCFLWTHLDIRQEVVPKDRAWLHETVGGIFTCFDMSDGNTPGSSKSPFDFPPDIDRQYVLKLYVNIALIHWNMFSTVIHELTHIWPWKQLSHSGVYHVFNGEAFLVALIDCWILIEHMYCARYS